MTVLETIWTFLTLPAVRAVVISLGRALFGWAENAFADGKVSRIEWKKLLETVMRMLPQAFAWSATGVPELAVVSDMGLVKVNKIVENGKAKKK